MIYGSETWALLALDKHRLERTEARMLRWMTGTRLKDRKSTEELRTALGIDSISDLITRARRRWYPSPPVLERRGRMVEKSCEV